MTPRLNPLGYLTVEYDRLVKKWVVLLRLNGCAVRVFGAYATFAQAADVGISNATHELDAE